MRWLGMMLVAAIVVGGSAHAATKQVGDWMVITEADRFADDGAKNTVVAATVNREMAMLALRCISGELSLGLGGRKFTTGDLFLIKFRADKNAVIDTAGKAINDSVLQVVTSRDMVRQMLTAKEYAIRVIGDAQVDHVFRAGRGASTALNEVVNACPAGSD